MPNGRAGRGPRPLRQAEELLWKNDIETTNDPETLGLWSAIHKRRAEMEEPAGRAEVEDAEEASRGRTRVHDQTRLLQRGGPRYLFNLRASLSSGDDRIAEYVFADRVRRMVVKITADRRARRSAPSNSPQVTRPTPPPDAKAWVKCGRLAEERYWVEATNAECLIALGDPSGEDLMKKALGERPRPVDGRYDARQARSCQGPAREGATIGGVFTAPPRQSRSARRRRSRTGAARGGRRGRRRRAAKRGFPLRRRSRPR